MTKRMTKAQRAQVVELLRVAADGKRNGIGLTWAGYKTGHCVPAAASLSRALTPAAQRRGERRSR